MSNNQDLTSGFDIANDDPGSTFNAEVSATDAVNSSAVNYGITAPSTRTSALPRFHIVEDRLEFANTCRKFKLDVVGGYATSGGIDTYILRDRENHDSDICLFTHSKKPTDKGWMSINMILDGKEHNGRPDYRIITFESNDTAFNYSPPWDDMIQSWTNTTMIYNAPKKPSEPDAAEASVPSEPLDPSEASKASVKDFIRDQLSVRRTDLGARGPPTDHAVEKTLDTCKNILNFIGNEVVRPRWPDLRKNYMSIASSPSQPSGEFRY